MADEMEWRAAYDAKVQDLARETARLSDLIAAVEAEGHRRDPWPRLSTCGVCQALKRVTADLGEDR